MEHIYLLVTIIRGEKKYLRRGIGPDGVNRYSVHYGELVAFETIDRANEVRGTFTEPDHWDLERFTINSVR